MISNLIHEFGIMPQSFMISRMYPVVGGLVLPQIVPKLGESKYH